MIRLHPTPAGTSLRFALADRGTVAALVVLLPAGVSHDQLTERSLHLPVSIGEVRALLVQLGARRAEPAVTVRLCTQRGLPGWTLLAVDEPGDLPAFALALAPAIGATWGTVATVRDGLRDNGFDIDIDIDVHLESRIVDRMRELLAGHGVCS